MSVNPIKELIEDYQTIPEREMVRNILEGLVTLSNLEAEVYLKYILVPKLKRNLVTQPDLTLIIKTLVELGYKFPLLEQITNKLNLAYLQ